MEVDDYVSISALQHYVFCTRQAALIHVERIWSDDAATTAGTLLHQRVDESGTQQRGQTKVLRALSLVCHQLRLRGIADMVEIRSDKSAPRGVRPAPIEMKRGKKKHERADQVQLCAQVLCLEEMFETSVTEGWIAYEGSHRRVAVNFDAALRQETEAAAKAMQALISDGRVPAAIFKPRKCARCSLLERCLPSVTNLPSEASRAIERLLRSKD